MTEVIQCKSCGSSNQFPEGRNSMFCAFCGTAIEKNIQEFTSSLKPFPKIISTPKKEIPFKETEWYKFKMQENEYVFKMNNTKSFKALSNIEHSRTNDGYNVVVIYDNKEIWNEYTTKIKETDFVPFEYDYKTYNSELNLNSMNIKSFKDLLQHYELKDLEEVKELNLDNNQINNWDGVMNFKRLTKLSLKNNLIETFPEKLPVDIINYEFDVPHTSIIKLDLTNNRIKTLEKITPLFDDKSLINLSKNPLEFEEINVKTFHIDEDGEELSYNLNAKLDSNQFLTFVQIKDKVDENVFQKKEEIESEKIGKCFIATATMGNYNHPEVKELRSFRDNWILKQNWGNNFVKQYYYYGEKVARRIENKILLKKISYVLIVKPLVLISRILKK